MVFYLNEYTGGAISGYFLANVTLIGASLVPGIAGLPFSISLTGAAMNSDSYSTNIKSARPGTGRFSLNPGNLP